MAMSKGFRVLEKSKPPAPHSILLEHRNKSETLLFESQAIAVLSSQETEVIRKQYSKVVDAYGCLGVLQLNAGESSVLYLVLVTGCFSVGRIGDTEIFRVTQTQFVSLQHQQPSEDRIGEVRKVLNSGTFYFSSGPGGGGSSSGGGVTPTTASFDLTLCAQRRPYTSEPDTRFFWNRMMFTHPMRFGVDTSFWLLRCMCGSVEVRTVYAGSRQARAAILSRLSCERAGTRFNVRGTNDDGHVANFVETEQVIYLDGEVTSYLQTRGSVPLFWEQPGVQVGSHKVRLSRGFEASKPAFERHMHQMRLRYGGHAIVNLLGTSLIGSKEGEAMLSQEFQRHHRESRDSDDVPHVVFDYHQECRGGQMGALAKLKARLQQGGRSHGWFEVFHANGDQVLSQQTGTIRTNCLDCLDRTNCVQTFLGLEVLGEQVRQLRLADKTLSRFDEVFRQMWVNNGNEVSKIYAGTGAIQGGSKLMDGARSAARTIQNNLLDNSKQEAIDILLVGSTLSSELADRARILLPSNMLHAPTPVLREMCKRYTEYVEAQEIRVAVGTFNVNGGKHFRSVAYKDLSLTDWLLDAHHPSGSLVDVTSSPSTSSTTSPTRRPHATGSTSSASTPVSNDVEPPADIVAVGFQEIVDLNASNIMAASTDNARAWAEELQKTLCRDRPYALLTYQQLVGVCLYVFVRPQHLAYIRDVAVDCVKTGLGGTTGNKGASAIRFVLYGTSMCFVAAHFAAGQSQVVERNADYAEITRKIAFPMGRSLKSHDYVFWCGDFNYRIDMDKDELRAQLQHPDANDPLVLAKIIEQDQLRKQQAAGAVFNDFQEGPITFQPTYKYDLFSEDYDTSEKMRAPAWTDRVLWRRRPTHPDADRSPGWNNGRLRHYGRAELKQSDHRPVIAIVDIELAQIDADRRQRVFDEVIADLGPPDATIVIHADTSAATDLDDSAAIYDEDLMATLIQELTQIGEVTLVRYVGETMWVTFRDGQSALTAVQKRETNVCGVRLVFRLKTDNWLRQVQQEIDLCTPNTVSLNPGDAVPDYNCLGIPKIPPQRPKTPSKSPGGLGGGPPARPPLPSKSPTPVSSPKHGVVDAHLVQRLARGMPIPMVPTQVGGGGGAGGSGGGLESPVRQPQQQHQNMGGYQDEEPNAIYEEINDDINIPEPREPPPPPPPAVSSSSSSAPATSVHSPSSASNVYDLDVNDDHHQPQLHQQSSPPSIHTSPQHTSSSNSAHISSPSSAAPPQQNPPPLPVRRGAPPPVPNRSGAPPPLPARPNAPQ